LSNYYFGHLSNAEDPIKPFPIKLDKVHFQIAYFIPLAPLQAQYQTTAGYDDSSIRFANYSVD
jgi:hypothetical protein